MMDGATIDRMAAADDSSQKGECWNPGRISHGLSLIVRAHGELQS